MSGERSFSIKRDFPDFWYDMANGNGDHVAFDVAISVRTFPPGLSDVKISNVAIAARSTNGKPCAYVAKLNDQNVTSNSAGIASGLSANNDFGVAAEQQLQFQLSDSALSPGSDGFLAQLRQGEVEDLLVVLTFAGDRAQWG